MMIPNYYKCFMLLPCRCVDLDADSVIRPREMWHFYGGCGCCRFGKDADGGGGSREDQGWGSRGEL